MFRSNTGPLLTVIGVLNITAFIGCQTMTGDNGETAKAENASTGVAAVEPSSAAVGHRVRVTADAPVFSEESKAYVQIGAQTAAILKVVSETQVDVLIPSMATGLTSVAIVEPEKDPGAPGQLIVLEPDAKQLLLSLNDGDLKLISAVPRGGEFHTVPQQDEPRIAFDVHNALGKIIFMGAIVDPTQGRFEIYDLDDGDEPVHVIRRAVPPASAVFPLMIPNLPGVASVQFYQADPGVDLNTEEGLRMRRFLTEIRFEENSEKQ
jgi:hypothetical protein